MATYDTNATMIFVNQKLSRWWYACGMAKKTSPLWSYSAAAIAARREILAMVARLTPMARCISLQLDPPRN